MKTPSQSKLLWFVWFFVFFAVFTFFMWYKTDTTTWRSILTLATNWLSQFKKGLDLAGWVRLTYKIDFSKYEETYANDPSQLAQVKKIAQDVILKNIDQRISKLWVSDYNAFVQKYSDWEYIVVEIGWVQDIEAAKNLIGKTVELEFKVPNQSTEDDPAVYAERQKIAESIFSEVIKNPSSMQDIGSSRWSQDVSYNTFTESTLDQLPMFYANNIDKISSIDSGTMYPALFTGMYHLSISASEWGQLETQTLKWFTMVLFKGKKEVVVDEIPLGDVLKYTEKNQLESTRSILRTYNWKTQDLRYDAASKSVIYVGEQDLPKQDWYDVVIFKVNSGADANATLAAIENGERKDVEEVISGWKTMADINTILPTYQYDEAKKVSLVTELDGAYIIKVRDTKKEVDTIYPTLTIKVSGEEQWNNIIKTIKNKTLYSFDDIFVSDSQKWVPAKDPQTNELLNGSYFQLANVGQSQTGKPVVSIQFNEKGKTIFCNLTEQHIGKEMAIFVGGKLMTAPVIRDKICGWTAQIDWSFDIKGARLLADDLNSWALPAPLQLSHEEKVAPSLWESALNGALLAWLVWLIIVYVIMFILYGAKKANIALIWLVTFLIYLLWWIKLFGVVSSLSGIAAIILSLGMAVDANILMYERIREELKWWKSMKTAIEDGYERSWAPIRDGNITTGIIWLLLFLVWVNVFKWFGTMMLINMVLILFIVTPLTKELLLLFYRSKK